MNWDTVRDLEDNLESDEIENQVRCREAPGFYGYVHMIMPIINFYGLDKETCTELIT